MERDTINSDSLAGIASIAQLTARSRDAREKDCFLLTTALRNTADDDPVADLAMSGSQEESVRSLIRRRSRYGRDSEPPSEKEARRIFQAQRPDAATKFETDRANQSSYWPGGAPVVDHLFVRVEHSPDWHCLLAALTKLRNHRLPNINDPHIHEEITLGETEERRVNEILEYYHAKVKQIKREFLICLLGADTESVSLSGNGVSSIIHGRPGQRHTVTLAQKRESGDPLPVVLMIGHVGWQINIRLPTTEVRGPRGEQQLRIVPGVLQEKVLELFKYLETLTGVGINEDLRKFFKVVKALYGEDLWDYTIPGVELDTLARFAGYNLVRYSLAALNLAVLEPSCRRG
jgi:hypothetical protein